MSGRIVPAETPLTAEYWAAARQGVILLQRCVSCGAVLHPPAPVCPGGVGHELEWFEASGLGRLASFTSVVHAAHPAVADRLPYLIALVELDEGPRIICNLALHEAVEPEPGARVVFRLGPTAGGIELPVSYLGVDDALFLRRGHRREKCLNDLSAGPIPTIRPADELKPF
jgi:uncharacterized protein